MAEGYYLCLRYAKTSLPTNYLPQTIYVAEVIDSCHQDSVRGLDQGGRLFSPSIKHLDIPVVIREKCGTCGTA